MYIVILELNLYSKLFEVKSYLKRNSIKDSNLTKHILALENKINYVMKLIYLPLTLLTFLCY